MKKYDSYKDSDIEWIGEVPEHWKVDKLNRIFQINTGFTPSTSNNEFYENGEHNWITIRDLEGKYVSKSKTKLTDIAVKGKTIIPKGSLLYSFKLSVGQMAFTTKDIYTNEAIFSVFPSDKLNLNYYYYLLDRILIHNSNENIYGAKILNQELIKASKLLVPSEEEQTQIANYLDHKTSQIDTLIAKKQQFISLLQEERIAVINQAVTKGLDPKVKLKDSGIEWLGEIPEHWEVKKLKYVANLKSGNNIISEQITQDGIYPVYGGNGLRGYFSDYTNGGNFVLIGRQGALCGNINYATDKFWASEHAIVCYLNPQNEWIWLGELLRIMNLNQYSQASAQPGLSVEKIKNLLIPVPNEIEQKKIVEYIFHEQKRIDLISSKTQQEIELLKEYKTALISEVVTGKVDVRNEKNYLK